MSENIYTSSNCIGPIGNGNKISANHNRIGGAERRATQDSYASRVSGQHLAGTGALVFEGELLEFPIWGSRAA